MKEAEWIDGIPRCPCGCMIFKMGMFLTHDDWLVLEDLECTNCGDHVKVTEAIVSFINNIDWKVRYEN